MSTLCDPSTTRSVALFFYAIAHLVNCISISFFFVFVFSFFAFRLLFAFRWYKSSRIGRTILFFCCVSCIAASSLSQLGLGAPCMTELMALESDDVCAMGTGGVTDQVFFCF